MFTAPSGDPPYQWWWFWLASASASGKLIIVLNIAGKSGPKATAPRR
jgi:hypothetical protein